MAAMLRGSSRLVVAHEPSPHLFGLGRLARTTTPADPVVSALDEAVRTCRQDSVSGAAVLGRRYVETSPQATFLAPNIRSVWPDAVFIALVRHPADVVRSGMRRGWYSGHPADATRLDPTEFGMSGLTPFEMNSWLWSETNRWVLDFLEESGDSPMVVRFEELAADPSSCIDRLCTHIGVEAPRDRHLRSVRDRRLNEQIEGSFPTYEHWESAQQARFRELTGEVASRLGYQVDDR